MKSLVIGSGFGGIAAALRLRAKGHDVTLVEKHKDLGGRARVFKKNGFIFDAGPTVITAPYLINELFELFNKKSENYINLKPLKTWYRFIFDDGSKFDYSGDEDLMKRQIEMVNKDLAARLGTEIQDALNKANAMQIPFEAEIIASNPAGNARVAALIKSLRTVEGTLEEVFTTLGFTIPVPE